MTRPVVSSYLVLCALAAALSSPSTTTCEAFAPASSSLTVHNAQSIYSATALNAQKKRRRKRKVEPDASGASPASAAAAPAAPASAEKADGATAAPAKLDAAAELKAAEMAFDLGADGFVGELGCGRFIVGQNY